MSFKAESRLRTGEEPFKNRLRTAYESLAIFMFETLRTGYESVNNHELRTTEEPPALTWVYMVGVEYNSAILVAALKKR